MQVTGVEVDAAMLRRARVATLVNHIENTEYCCADLFQPDPDVAWMGWQYDRILLDPPRSGALEMVQTIGRFDAARIVVVRIRTGESGSAAL